jgi:hypothetical protein
VGDFYSFHPSTSKEGIFYLGPFCINYSLSGNLASPI